MSTLKYILKKYNISFDKNTKMPVEIADIGRNDLARLIHELNFKVGVEVGVASGEYSEILCQTNPQMKISGVDPWKPYRGYTDYVRLSTFSSLYNTALARLSPFINYKFVKELSMDALKRFQDNSLDFVYLDANHQNPYIAQDITQWYKKVKFGGILAGHDYTNHLDVVGEVNRFTNQKNIKPWFILGSKDNSMSWIIIK